MILSRKPDQIRNLVERGNRRLWDRRVMLKPRAAGVRDLHERAHGFSLRTADALNAACRRAGQITRHVIESSGHRAQPVQGLNDSQEIESLLGGAP